MNRYLAVCHAFALLESPLAGPEFSQAVANNPLFSGSCALPQPWLDWLCEEGLLTEQNNSYQFSAVGEQMYRHVLNWTARDKQAVAERTASRRSGSGEAPISPACPACGSDFCANYLSVILIENFNADRARWQSDEARLLNRVLADCQARHPAARLYLLADTEPLSDLSEAFQLPEDFGLTLTEIQAVLGQRQTLPQLNTAEHVRVPRLRFELGLLPADSLTALRRIAYPTLFPALAAGQPESRLLRLTQPALSPDRKRALIGLSTGPERQLLAYILSDDDSWQAA